jgi:hypothetical protein
MATSVHEQSPAVGRTTIPLIDLAAYLAGAPGALEATAAELRDALEDVGFFIVVNHGVSPHLIERTFAEARRFHDQPLEAKMALRMNEHNNGYMAMNRYAVWTSDVNTNTRPDLNEAFFTKRERGPDDPLVTSGRRFAGPNRWPENLPGFRDTVLAYTDAVDALGRRLLPACATALELAPDHFDRAFAESQFSFRLSHYAAHGRQLPHLPRADRRAGTSSADAVRRLARRAVRAALLRGELGRHDGALDQRPVQVDPASRPAARGRAPLRDPVLPRTPHGHRHRLPADVPGAGPAREVSADHLRRLPALVVRRQLQGVAPGRRHLIA